jgi:hypothetical protein
VKNTILPNLQNFLVSRPLVPEKNVFFYANWVSKFLVFCNRNEHLRPDLKVEKFLNYLKSQKNIADWQIKQTDDALRLYFHHFLDGKPSILFPGLPPKSFSGFLGILTEMRQRIQVPFNG